jgi:hypothetical protein
MVNVRPTQVQCAASEAQIVNGVDAQLGLREDVFHLVEDGSALRLVLYLRNSLKLLQQLTLSLRKFRWRLHPDFNE